MPVISNILNFKESGHYYSYINDFETGVWRKYNDIHINEETEEKVFEDALGIKFKFKFRRERKRKRIFFGLSIGKQYIPKRKFRGSYSKLWNL